MELTETANVKMRGDITLLVCDADGNVVEERHERNLLCNAGLATLAAAVCWDAAADQSANMGGFPTVQVMWPLYGAVGTASPTPNVLDLQLGTELARGVLAEASYSGGQVLFSFFFGTTLVDWPITECGVFCEATSASGSGFLLNHSVFTTVTKLAAQTLTMMASFTFSN